MPRNVRQGGSFSCIDERIVNGYYLAPVKAHAAQTVPEIGNSAHSLSVYHFAVRGKPQSAVSAEVALPEPQKQHIRK